MPEQKFYLTKQGLKKIKDEYKELLKQKQLKIKRGVPLFLHSEEVDSEFISFREDFEQLELRIQELGRVLKNFELIKPPLKNQRNRVHLGATLKIDLDDEIDEFTIVGTMETDPVNKKISDQSPIGKALMGHRVGDKVVIKTSIVNHICRILKIEYNS